MGSAIDEGNFKSTKLYIISLAWPWKIQKSLFHFHSPKGNGGVCICSQCGRYKQNLFHSFGKIAFIHESAIDLRVITIAYMIDYSQVNISSQISVLYTNANLSYGYECKCL